MQILQLAEREDWEVINRISKQVLALHATWSPERYEVVGNPYPMEYFLEDIQEKCLYTAKIENQVVGYVRFRIWETNGAGSVKQKIMQIEEIGVEETQRHRGIGKKMMADLKEVAYAHGCAYMKLYVDVKNEDAFAYYKNSGFKVNNIGMQMKM